MKGLLPNVILPQHFGDVVSGTRRGIHEYVLPLLESRCSRSPPGVVTYCFGLSVSLDRLDFSHGPRRLTDNNGHVGLEVIDENAGSHESTTGRRTFFQEFFHLAFSHPDAKASVNGWGAVPWIEGH